MNTTAFIPDFHALRNLTEVSGVKFTATHQYAYTYILTVAEQGTVSFNYEYLAKVMCAAKKTARQTVDSLIEMGLISSSKGRHSHLTFKVMVMPWEIKELSQEAAESVKQAWLELYS